MWPFGHTCKDELRALRDELAELREETKKRIGVLEYEWADWYGKFRLLHARLAKQEKAAHNDAGTTNGDEPHIDAHPTGHLFRTRRGF